MNFLSICVILPNLRIGLKSEKKLILRRGALVLSDGYVNCQTIFTTQQVFQWLHISVKSGTMLLSLQLLFVAY